MSEPVKPIYAPMPARALADTRLSGTDFRLLAAIAAHDRFGKNGTGCFASQRRLAALIGAHEKAVARSAGRLVEFGYVATERSPTNGRLVIYRVVYNEDDAHAMRGDGRSFTRPAGLKLAPAPETGSNSVTNEPPATGNKSATDSARREAVENPRSGAKTGSKSVTDQGPIGNTEKLNAQQNQGAASANIFCERDNRLREARLGKVNERGDRPPDTPPAAHGGGGQRRDELLELVSIDEQVTILRRVHEGATPSAALLGSRLCRRAKGAA